MTTRIMISMFLLTTLILAAGAAADTATRVYWTEWNSYNADESRIARANLDGSGEETLFSGFVDGVGVKDLAIDQDAGKLYFANRSVGLIERANLDGSGRETVVTDANAIGLAIDTVGGKLYWADYTYSDPTIRRADLDGANEQELHSCNQGCSLEGIVLDPANGFIYWAERMTQNIYRGYMDGGWHARILHCADGIGHPHGLVLHGGRLYWGTDDALMSATELGDDVQTVIGDLPGDPQMMELDAEAGRIYWTMNSYEGNMVQSVALNGSGLQTHLTDLRMTFGLALEMGEAVPVPDLALAALQLTCHPNPFNPTTTLSFELPAAALVRLEIHNLDGSLVELLVDGWRSAGRHSAAWDGRDRQGRAMPSGVYLGRVTAGGKGESQRLTLVR